MPGLVTSSIARSAAHRYLSYSEVDFEVFCPAGATCCTDGGEIRHRGGDQRDRQTRLKIMALQVCNQAKNFLWMDGWTYVRMDRWIDLMSSNLLDDCLVMT